jgi:anaerobic ribonucleoside-triphosphate reductase activating protein
MNYISVTYPDVNNGEGCRVTLWVAGCTHHCKGCHNPQSWNFNSGKLFTDEVKKELFNVLGNSYIKGLTLSGGDPLDSFDDVFELVKEIKEIFKDKDIWLFSGYSLEEIKNSEKSVILEYIDVLVDGEFKEELKDLTLAFRGSSNQRILKKVNNDF